MFIGRQSCGTAYIFGLLLIYKSVKKHVVMQAYRSAVGRPDSLLVSVTLSENGFPFVAIAAETCHIAWISLMVRRFRWECLLWNICFCSYSYLPICVCSTVKERGLETVLLLFLFFPLCFSHCVLQCLCLLLTFLHHYEVYCQVILVYLVYVVFS